jgi:histone deacetylase 1/2
MVYGSLLTKHFNVNFLYVRQTGVALGVEVDDKMPQHEYYEYFGPDYTLHVAPSNMENKNSRQLLDDIRANLLDNLSKLQHAPSVQFQERPPDTELPEVSSSLFCSMCPFLAPSFISHRT